MYLLYVDHSGEVYNPLEKYFVIGAVAVFERTVYFLSEALNELQRAHLPELTERVEFHASAIRRHEKPPWDSITGEKRRELFEAIYRTIAEMHTSASIFGQAVEKSFVVPGFKERMGDALRRKKEAEDRVESLRGPGRAEAKAEARRAHEESETLARQIVARGFEGLCTQFEFFLREFYDETRPEQQQRGLMIFDHASYQREIEFLMEQYRSIGTRVTRLYNVAEVPLFTRSDASRMLQIADFVSFAIYRRYESGDTAFFDAIAGRFHERDGVVHGLAHVASSFSACMCSACLSRRSARRG